MSNKDFWCNFYKEEKLINYNSSFSEYIHNTYIKHLNDNNIFMKIGDFGCGNCRDSRFFAEKGNKVFAIDKYGVNHIQTANCEFILKNVFSYIGVPDRKEIIKINKLQTLLDIIYMRWFLHTMPYNSAEEIFNHSINILKPDGLICIEVRSLNDKDLIQNSIYDECDKSYSTTHKRWLYNKDILYKLAKNKDLEILEYNEDYYSLNKDTETQNPLLIRFILKKNILPYYEKSTNYKSYKHIIPQMREHTLQTYTDMNILNIILEKHKIQYVSVAGTILGLNRHGGIIPWDNDIDLGFLDTEWKKLFDIKDELEINGLFYRFNKKNHCHFGKIDCFLLEKKKEYYIGDAKTYCHIDEYEHIYKQKFGYTYVYAPFCSIKSLKHRYGNNYFTEGNVNDNFHFKDKSVKKFNLTPEDYSFQIK
jgi:SAM-dependent methyltransferase